MAVQGRPPRSLPKRKATFSSFPSFPPNAPSPLFFFPFSLLSLLFGSLFYASVHRLLVSQVGWQALGRRVVGRVWAAAAWNELAQARGRGDRPTSLERRRLCRTLVNTPDQQQETSSTCLARVRSVWACVLTAARVCHPSLNRLSDSTSSPSFPQRPHNTHSSLPFLLSPCGQSCSWLSVDERAR